MTSLALELKYKEDTGKDIPDILTEGELQLIILTYEAGKKPESYREDLGFNELIEYISWLETQLIN